jgi:hypothetical protein
MPPADKDKNSDALESQSIQQQAILAGDAPLMNGPWFFKNHLTGGQDVAFQDNENNLYLFSVKGKRYWKRKLDGPILGDIHALDTYKNGRLQLAFTTASRLYNLDRNGKDHGPFPVSIKGITQGLALFDYDKNRNYRLLITTGEDLKMYNAEGDRVNGFKYQRSGVVLATPQHFRESGKDYILVSTKDKGLRILSRTGETRTQLERKIEPEGKLVKVGKSTYLVSEEDLVSLDLATGDTRVMAAELKNNRVLASPSAPVYVKETGIHYQGIEPLTKADNLNSMDVDGNYLAVQTGDDNQIKLFDLEQSMNIGFPVYGENSVHLKATKKKLYVLTLEDGKVIVYGMGV